ncbi:Diguanylate cyclase (GGDEF) domain-containing protein [Tumidithrix helvetica PCC 7403]|uniref:diguanylate cyclase domain-containing protein n=1 Tax=Tumidithrix helvetica TaxID=3457545 RepID=UPI003C85C221
MIATSETEATILIVDDNPINLEVLYRALSDKGYEVRVEVDGINAIAQIHLQAPDLILLDVRLPGIDGFEVCRQLKEDEQTMDIPIIFMSALADTEDKLIALDLGAVDYITKPFQKEEVLARVRLHLKLRQLTQALEAQNQELNQLTEELEERVRERTLALQHQNAALEIARKEAEQAAIELEVANKKLYELATMDGLTTIANRRRFDEYWQQQWQMLAQQQQPLSLILADVDHFKLYNDCYGHILGDECLQQVAHSIRLLLKRPTDLVARYGGEEFAVILPYTSIEGASRVAEAIAAQIYDLALPHAKSPISDRITLSLGISCIVPQYTTSLQDPISSADKALYQAKQSGRNRYCISG